MSCAAARGHTGRGDLATSTRRRAPRYHDVRPSMFRAGGGGPCTFLRHSRRRPFRARTSRTFRSRSVRVPFTAAFFTRGNTPDRVHVPGDALSTGSPGLVRWKGGGKCSTVRVRAPVRDTRRRARDVTPP